MSAWEACGKSDEWYTPKYIFDALGCEFDIDVAGAGGSWVPCKMRYCELGLQQRWAGFVWMNPPFGGRNAIEPWLDRFFAHGDGIALTPDRTSAPWFQKAAKQANALLFISPKVKFERPDRTLGKSPGCGTVLMSVGSRGRAALLRSSKLGLVALPNRGVGSAADTRDRRGSPSYGRVATPNSVAPEDQG